MKQDGARRAFWRFAAVGGVGFAVDAGVLFGLTALGGNPYLVRLLSFALAVSVTFGLNRHWTFSGARARGIGRDYLAYIGVQTFGVGINYGVYAAVLALIGLDPARAVLALAAGSATAFLVNYWGARRVVFRAAAT